MHSKLKFSKNRRILSKLPNTPGVYLFWDGAKVIYVGKAVNIKNRVSSYLSLDLAPKTRAMVAEANGLSFVRVESELEALLLESALIKKNQPRYNFAAKDDKHPLYIRITNEVYPRVLTARKIEEGDKNIAFYGPFPSSSSLREVLGMLRKAFPYSDHKLSRRPCILSHIGLCNPCPSIIAKEADPKIKNVLKKSYFKNIRMLRMVLERRSKKAEEELMRTMNRLAQDERYEEAIKVRDQLIKLYYVTQKPTPAVEFLKNPNILVDLRNEELKSLKTVLSRYLYIENLKRIECFDVAHLAGTSPTASMVTFINAEAEKSLYRRFRINQRLAKSDVHSLKEVAKRRLNRLEDWGEPDLIIVDGGKPQVDVFRKSFEKWAIPVIGLAKKYETIVVPVRRLGAASFKEIRLPAGPALSLIVRIRDEAHRFARVYHHLLVKKSLLA
jgi:excinuclease ABC subunit C